MCGLYNLLWCLMLEWDSIRVYLCYGKIWFCWLICLLFLFWCLCFVWVVLFMCFVWLIWRCGGGEKCWIGVFFNGCVVCWMVVVVVCDGCDVVFVFDMFGCSVLCNRGSWGLFIVWYIVVRCIRCRCCVVIVVCCCCCYLVGCVFVKGCVGLVFFFVVVFLYWLCGVYRWYCLYRMWVLGWKW